MLLSNYILFVFGFIIVIGAVFLIRKDLMDQSRDASFLDKKEDEFLRNIEVAEDIIQELNDIGEKIINRLDDKIIEVNGLIERVEGIIKNGEHYYGDMKSVKDENPIVEEVNIHYVEERTNDEEDTNFLGGKEMKKILELAHSGQSPSEIAKLLNKGIGEINLILNIKKR